MVTFTCQDCNSCLKKKAVDVHLYKCKNPQLTCIDCLKDFDRESYVGHVTCVTENQRYGGQGFVQSSAMVKQSQWIRCINTIANSGNITVPNLKLIYQHAASFPTCPRNKKKFVNFILNMNAFSKMRTLAEKAYDTIAEEFNKVDCTDQNQNEKENGKVSDVNNVSKRKTISETELQAESEKNGVTNESNSKKSKNKKIHGDTEPVIQVAENNAVNKKKSKKKNKLNGLVSNTDDLSLQSNNKINGNNTLDQGDSYCQDTNQSIKKKKNKDKHRKNVSHTVDDKENSKDYDLKDNVDDEDNTAKPSNDSNIDDLSKLSKKERKKLLKQKKYEAEIESIENFKKEDDCAEEIRDESEEKRKKKKNKHQGVDEEDRNRQQKNSISEPEDKKIKLEGEHIENEPIVVEKPKKFKWDEVIIQVLEAQSDGEMSLKRLSKKVIAEYANVYGERESYDEVALKFNKKVVRTPGVRVLKDKAKLVSDS